MQYTGKLPGGLCVKQMRFVKAVFMIALGMPCLVWANGETVSVADTRAPVGRIYDAVQLYSDLRDSVFVFLLRDQINANGYVTLEEVAQACVNVLGQAGIDRCQSFMRSVIGNGVSGTDGVFVAHFNTEGRVSFEISAKGTFYVDCGNGVVQTISINGEGATEPVECERTSEIKISGSATGYSNDENTPVINFINNTNLTKVSGALGEIFPTINGVSPRFVGTFWECENLTDIMDLSFENITVGAKNMFWGTFGKTGIKSIPAGLFSGLKNASAERMFAMTFYGCSKLERIPLDLFESVVNDGVSLPTDMFKGTFANCSIVSGKSPKVNGKRLDEIPEWGGVATACYCQSGKLSDYGLISNNWK